MKKLKYVGLFICMALCMTACSNQQKNKMQSATETNYENDTEDAEQTLDARIEIATGGCKIAEEGEDIQQGPITYRVNQVTWTKQRGNWIDMSGPTPELDANNMIIGDETYIVVNVTIKETETYEFWWNFFR